MHRGKGEALQRSQLKNDTSIRQRNSPTKSSLAMHGKSERKKGATALKILQTPIGLFEDECVFCHSFRTSQFHGSMVRYLNGRLVSCTKGNPSNIIYVHQKCLEWAPRVYFEGDIIMDLESEIKRASKLRCSRCKRPGAALGCCDDFCKKSFHVPCAMMILDCRWDVDGRRVWCPKHASEALPCDDTSSPRKKSDSSSLTRGQCLVKEGNSIDCQMEDKKPLQANTSNPSYFAQVLCLNEQEISTIHKREDQQVDQINTSSSCLTQEQYLDKQGISSYHQRVNTQKEQLNTSGSCPMDQWVLFGLELCASEKDSLQEFASWTNVTVTMEWGHNVTHVIVGKYAGSACRRSYEVLMAILLGRWVVTIGWIMDCLAELIPLPGLETSYEVKFSDDSHTTIDGPMKGRIRSAEGAPKLFCGLSFCLSAYMSPSDRELIQDLVVAGGGEVSEASDSDQLRSPPPRGELGAAATATAKRYFFVYDGAPPRASTAAAGSPLDQLDKEVEEGVEHAVRGAQVVSHLSVLDAIAAHDARVLHRKGRFTTPSPCVCE